MREKIGIIGSQGTVGSSLKKYFQKTKSQLFFYDIKGEGSIEEVNKADYIFICVPTPTKPNGMCDVGLVDASVGLIKGEKVVIIKSTVIPGTTDKLQKKYPKHKILFNPEFLTEATVDQDMNYPDRQIVGYTKKSYSVAENIMLMLPLSPFEKIVPAYIAEFSKYANNTWFAVKVAKNNELYDVFEKFGGSREEFESLVECMSADKRIGRTHLNVWHNKGRGYSGKCLPKDTKAFIKFAGNLKVKTPISEATDKYNDFILKNYGYGK